MSDSIYITIKIKGMKKEEHVIKSNIGEFLKEEIGSIEDSLEYGDTVKIRIEII